MNFKFFAKKTNLRKILSSLLLVLNLLIPYVFLGSIASSKDLDSKKEEVCLLKGYVSKVPGGTKLKIILETPIDEVTSMVDDEVIAKISEDVVIDKNVIFPIGTTVYGTITEINSARRLHMAGSVRIEFKSLSTPDGKEVPIVASALSSSGLVKGKLTKKNALISSATVIGPAAAGLGAGLAAEGSAVGAAVGAAAGLVAGLGLFAFQRGNMVDIKSGEEMTIELVEEAIVKNEPSERSDSLDLDKSADIDEKKEIMMEPDQESNKQENKKEEINVEF